MNLGTQLPAESKPLAAGFTLSDLAACCVPVVLLVASIASLL